jgi:hypothetical protein
MTRTPHNFHSCLKEHTRIVSPIGDHMVAIFSNAYSSVGHRLDSLVDCYSNSVYVDRYRVIQGQFSWPCLASCSQPSAAYTRSNAGASRYAFLTNRRAQANHQYRHIFTDTVVFLWSASSCAPVLLSTDLRLRSGVILMHTPATCASIESILIIMTSAWIIMIEGFGIT